MEVRVRKLPSILALTVLCVGAVVPVARAQWGDSNGDFIERNARSPRGVRSGEAASLLFFVHPVLCPDTSTPCFGYEPAYDRRGRPIGRWVPLNGDIDGLNFEPGVCAREPYLDPTTKVKMYCLAFGDGVMPGTFKRALPGTVAFTRCHCTVEDVGDSLIPDLPLQIVGNNALTKALRAYDRLQRQIEEGRIDSYFTLHIQYFDPGQNPNYPAGYTEFDMFDGRGRLRGLFGSGVLDFGATTEPPITFTYWLRDHRGR